jgi:hypothetical protein
MMNTVTKSAIVAATIAGAAATSLRFEVAANTNFEDSLQMTSYETSFIEKAFAEHDCVGNTMQKLDQLMEKNREELEKFRLTCLQTGKTSKTRRTQTEHDEMLRKIDALEEKRKTGDYPIIYACDGLEAHEHELNCDEKTPTSEMKVRTDANLNIADAENKSSDDRIDASAALVTTAERKYAEKQNEEKAHDETVRLAIEEKSEAFDDRILGFNTDMATEQQTLETNKNTDITEAETAKRTATDDCDTIKKARMALIKKDADVLDVIKGHLQTLKICTAAHETTSSGGTAFLEIKAAQRLEAHCAVSRKMVARAIPTGDFTDWSERIAEETKIANENAVKCYATATEVERLAVHGIAIAGEDSVSGIIAEYNKALTTLTSTTTERIAEETKDKDEMREIEENKKMPYQESTKAAKDALQYAKDEHCVGVGETCTAGVQFDEAAEKVAIQKRKKKDDDDAQAAFNVKLREQEEHLTGKRTALNNAFNVETTGIETECTEDIKDLEAEAKLIREVSAKIGALQVVHGDAGAGTDSGISLHIGADASDALANHGEEPQGLNGKFSPDQQAKYGIDADGKVLHSGKLKQATDTSSAGNEAAAPAPPAPRAQA